MAPPIFKHFYPPAGVVGDKFRIQCRYCNKFVSGSYATTSNFHTHMKRNHPQIVIDGKCSVNISQPPVSTMPAPAGGNMASIAPFPWNYPDSRQIELTHHVLNFLSSSLMPLSTVEDPTFRALLRKAQPAYNLPSRKDFHTKFLPFKKAKIHTRINDYLGRISIVSLTVDVWTSRNMKAYVGITAYFIDNFKLVHAMLACKQFKGVLSAETILHCYQQVIYNYNLDCKVGTIITENASDILRATVRFPGVEQECPESGSESEDESPDSDPNESTSTEVRDLPNYIPCFLHSLQLVVKDGLKEIGHAGRIITKAAKIANFLNQPSLAPETLVGERKLMPTADDTTWNGTTKMLVAILNVDPTMLENLGYPEKITEDEKKVIKEITEILNPFEVASDQCQGLGKVTASLVIPCIRGLREELKELTKVYADSKFLAALHCSVNKRLQKYEEMEAFQLATVLDPRWKLGWCKADTDEARAITKLLGEKVLAITPPATSTATTSTGSSGPPQKRCKLFRFMASGSTSEAQPGSSSSQPQVQTYLSQPNIPEEEDPLLYWKEKWCLFPELAILAVNYLSVPASSALVEHLKPVAGKSFRPHRSWLSDARFQELMFLKCNNHLV